MVLYQINIPKDLDEKIAIKSIKLRIKDKRKTVIRLLTELLKD